MTKSMKNYELNKVAGVKFMNHNNKLFFSISPHRAELLSLCENSHGGLCRSTGYNNDLEGNCVQCCMTSSHMWRHSIKVICHMTRGGRAGLV